MGMWSRFIRLCKADLHGVMDQMENRALLLKQYLREMDAAVKENEARLNGLGKSKKEIQSLHNKYAAEIEKSEADLKMAVTKKRDDIARLLIRKIKPVKAHLETLNRQMAVIDAESDQLRETIEKQRMVFEKIRIKSLSYLHHADHERPDGGTASAAVSLFPDDEPTAEEVELELMRQKDMILGGVER